MKLLAKTAKYIYIYRLRKPIGLFALCITLIKIANYENYEVKL